MEHLGRQKVRAATQHAAIHIAAATATTAMWTATGYQDRSTATHARQEQQQFVAMERIVSAHTAEALVRITAE